jgi:hypothetical protein
MAFGSEQVPPAMKAGRKCGQCTGCRDKKGCLQKTTAVTRLDGLMQFLQVAERPALVTTDIKKSLSTLTPYYRKKYTDQAAFVARQVFQHLYGNFWHQMLDAAATASGLDGKVPEAAQLKEKAHAAVVGIVEEANAVAAEGPNNAAQLVSKILVPLAGHFTYPELTALGLADGIDRRSFYNSKKRQGTWRLGCSPQGKQRTRGTRVDPVYLCKQAEAIDFMKSDLTSPIADRPIVLCNSNGVPTIFGGRQRRMGRDESYRAYLQFFRRRYPDLAHDPLSRSQFLQVLLVPC